MLCAISFENLDGSGENCIGVLFLWFDFSRRDRQQTRRHQRPNWNILASMTALSWCWTARLHRSYPTPVSVFPPVFIGFTTRNPRSRCPASVLQVRSLTCARSKPRNPQPRRFPVLILSAAPCTTWPSARLYSVIRNSVPFNLFVKLAWSLTFGTESEKTRSEKGHNSTGAGPSSIISDLLNISRFSVEKGENLPSA